MHRALIATLASLSLVGCTFKAPTATKNQPIAAEGVVAGRKPLPAPKTGVSTTDGKSGAGIISNNGAGIISNNGSNLIGRVTAPAGLISNSGGTIISNNGGSYRVLAVSEAAVAGADVVLVGADGQPVKDAKGQTIQTKTDAQGNYKLPFGGATSHLLARVTLPAQKGDLLALVPRREAKGDRTVDLNFRSTLVMGYILGQYVKGDPKILEKLPEDVEAETRTKMASALASSSTPAPASLSASDVSKTVDALRRENTAIDDQMEKVKRILLVGLSDQGVGRDALSVETDATSLAVSPSGEVFYGGVLTSRVWHRDAGGLLRAYAGTGQSASAALVASTTPDKPAPGDGGPAAQATLTPFALDFDGSGNLYVADAYFKRVRKIDTTGTITTLAAHADWDSLCGLVVAPDGTVYTATKTAIFSIAPDKTITQVAGGPAGTPATGPVASLRFSGITDLTMDPVKGYLYALDASRVIVEIKGPDAVLLGGAFSGVGGIDFQPDGSLMMADAVNRKIFLLKDWVKSTVAGSGAFGLTGDGGPATAAAMCNPAKLAVGRDGAIYTVDAGFVRRIKDGTITTVIGKTSESGTTPADQAQLRGPKGLVYDAASHSLLIAELWRVRKWDLGANQLSTFAGAGLTGAAFQEGGAPTASSLVDMFGLAHDATSGLTYLATDGALKRRLVRQLGNKLQTLAGNGTDVTPAGLLGQIGKPALDAAVPANCWAVAVKGDMAFYALHVAGTPAQAVVLQVTPGGNVTELCRVNSDLQSAGLAVTPDGSGLVIGALSAIHRYDFASKQVTALATATDADLNTPKAMGLPSGFAFDASGALYYADYAIGRVNRLNMATGAITLVAGKGAPLLAGSRVDDGLTTPWGVAIDRDGNLYISDSGANQIKRIPAAQLPR